MLNNAFGVAVVLFFASPERPTGSQVAVGGLRGRGQGGVSFESLIQNPLSFLHKNNYKSCKIWKGSRSPQVEALFRAHGQMCSI